MDSHELVMSIVQQYPYVGMVDRQVMAIFKARGFNSMKIIQKCINK